MRAQKAEQGMSLRPRSSSAARFAGCYHLTVSPNGDYRLRLTLQRVGDSRRARAYGSGARNAAGDTWSWTPINDSTFAISWDGIDSAMDFWIVRHGMALVASGDEQSLSPVQHTHLDARVHRIACPSHAR